MAGQMPRVHVCNRFQGEQRELLMRSQQSIQGIKHGTEKDIYYSWARRAWATDQCTHKYTHVEIPQHYTANRGSQVHIKVASRVYSHITSWHIPIDSGTYNKYITEVDLPSLALAMHSNVER